MGKMKEQNLRVFPQTISLLLLWGFCPQLPALRSGPGQSLNYTALCQCLYLLFSSMLLPRFCSLPNAANGGEQSTGQANSPIYDEQEDSMFVLSVYSSCFCEHLKIAKLTMHCQNNHKMVFV